MKKTLIALMMAAAGSLFPGAVKAEDKAPKFGAWGEIYTLIDRNGADLYVPRLELSRDGSNFLVAEHINTEGYQDTRAGTRVSVNVKDAVKGNVGVYGHHDTAGNHGLGADFDGTLADFLELGGALEATEGSQLEHVFVGKKFPIDLTAKLGYFRRDETSHLNGAVWQTLGDYFIGVGGQVDEEGKGKINLCFAKYASKKGEGIGGRAWAQYDFDGNFHIEGILTVGNNFTLPSCTGVMNLHDGGLNDPALFKNVANIRPKNTPYRGNTLAVKFAVDKAKGMPAVYTAEAYVNLGNAGPVSNIRVGGAWQHEDVSNPRDVVSAFLASDIGPICAELVTSLQQGEKPKYAIWVGTGVGDCIDYVKKQLED